jgi:hypothetical protein
MKPIEFKEQNEVLAKPPNMTDKECQSLNVFTDGKQSVSCWEITDEELKEIIKTKKIWLGVIGNAHPLVFIEAFKPFS